MRYAIRSLMKTPAFTLLTVLILAVGVAGTIVMVTLIQGVLLRPLPIADEDRVIVAWKAFPSYAHAPFGDVEIDGVRQYSRLLESVAGLGTNRASPIDVVNEGNVGYVNEALVTGGFFEVLGVKPVLGRTLTRADDLDGAERVVVISHGLWQRRYGGSHDVIGRRLSDEGDLRIVGVMPPDVDYPRGVEVWRSTRSVQGKWKDPARSEVDLIGRLRPGVTIEQATSELGALLRQIESEAPAGTSRDFVPVVHSLKDEVVGNVRPIMMAFFGAVAFVLLIASANAANLLLMRNEARRGELAVRMALGAGRGRIAGQVLMESLVLAFVAAAAGLVLTWWSLEWLVTLVPDGIPRVESVRIDAGIVLFTIALAFVTAAFTGLAPAFSLGADLVSHLRNGGRGVVGSASRLLRRTFVVAEVALAVTIIAGAGLLTRTVLRLQAIDTGLSERLVFVEVSMPAADHADRERHFHFLNTLMRQFEAIPSIAAATPINAALFAGVRWDIPRFTAEGQSPERVAENPSLAFESIFPNYFRTLEVPITAGRAFTDADRQGATNVVIISRDVAERVWPGENPVGKRLKMGGYTSKDEWLTVVGVAAPTRHRELTDARPTLYLPAAQFLVTAQILALRTTAPLDQVTSMSRDLVRAINPRAQVRDVSSFDDLLKAPLARPRFNALLLNIFGVVAVLLATIGLYAVMSMYVRQRDRDIAVRRALGATAGDVRRLVLAEALWLAALGATIGVAGAAGATRLLRGLLYEIDPLDPPTIVGAAILLVAASTLAAWLPVRRATRVDPLVALRYE